MRVSATLAVGDAHLVNFANDKVKVDGFCMWFIVAEDGVFQPYWPLSPNSFGGQINATSNGDLPGDIYRLLGGVVLRPKEGQPEYAGYMASGFILPGGTGNNRVIAAGAEALIGPTGQTARFFLVGTRPAMTYQTGSTFGPAVQIDPILPANVSFTLNCPDGRMPGLPPEGGEIYVVERDEPADAAEIRSRPMRITGASTAVIPGAVIDQGIIGECALPNL